MIKRGFIILVTAAIFIFLPIEKEPHASNKGPLIKATLEKANIYDNRTGKLVKTGELFQGEVYRAVRQYGENWYEIIFADKTGYVPRFAVQEVTGVSLINEKTTEALSGDFIKTSANLTVYDNSTGSLIPFGVILKDVKYPILAVYGNWYKIEVAGRIGFVHKNYTQFIPKPNTKPQLPPPALKGNYVEIVRDTAEVYDNRTGKLVKTGELLKGHVVKITRPYGTNWVEIKYADRTGYVARVTVKEASKTAISNENKYYLPLGDLVRITSDTTVFDNSTGSLVPFAKISKNTVYPILSRYGSWYRIDVAGRIGFIHKNSTTLLSQKIKTSNTSKIPVLMYHHLLQQKENRFPNNSVILNLENFKEQMNYLSRNGFQTISLSDMEAYIRGNIKLRNKTVLLTFDDGLKTNHLYALPVIKQYGYQAGAFIITGRITNSPSTFNPGNNQALSVPEMNEMRSNFQFGSHTAALHQLVNKQSLVLIKNSDVVLNDFIISRKYLNTRYFCYPFGKYNDNIIGLVKKAGYTSAYTTKTGYATTKTNPHEIPRYGIYPFTSMNEFALIVNGKK